MPANPPVDFEERVKRPKGTTNADYPYAISARDLMQDFVFATLDVDPTLIEETTGTGGHKQRRLRITPGDEPNQIAYWDGSDYVPLAAAPGSGTYVLGAVNGTIQWIETEECT